MLITDSGGLIRPPSGSRHHKDHLLNLLTSPWYSQLHRVSAIVHSSTRQFMERQGFENLHLPVTTLSISSPMGLGSDSEPVEAQIGGRSVFLADSQQFLLELGVRIGKRPQYYISSSFRGEAVDHTHLSEFTHAEVEIIGDLDSVIDLGGRYVSELASCLARSAQQEILGMVGTTHHLEHVGHLEGKFPRLTFRQASELVGGSDGALKTLGSGVQALTRTGEKLLLTEFGAPVWITHMPALSCPFYQRRIAGSDLCASADLLLGPGEILGAGARCVGYGELLASLSDHNVPRRPYEWYIEMKRKAPLETAGFGLGVERFLMWALDAHDIRDCTPWIRRQGEVIGP
jgi:asparaginyl-tRNA synthetase